MIQKIKNFFKKRKSLFIRVEKLEKRMEEMEQKLIQKRESESVPFSQVVDEWINGKEGDDE